MYQVVTEDGFVMMETDFFSKAVGYAKENGWNIYSTKNKRLIYDGFIDVLYID